MGSLQDKRTARRSPRSKRRRGGRGTDHRFGSSFDHLEGDNNDVLFTVWFLEYRAESVFFFVSFRQVVAQAHVSRIVSKYGRCFGLVIFALMFGWPKGASCTTAASASLLALLVRV